MKVKMLIAAIIVLGFIYNCKSGNQAETENNNDSADVTEEKSDSAEMEEITGGFMGIKHHSMMQKDAVTLHGDPDYDFATVMKIHHRHGIAMADEEVKYGADTTMQKLAQKIKDNQENELKELEEFLTNNNPANKDDGFLKEMNVSMQKAKEEMNQSPSMSGNFDRDFSSLMILHHQHGLDLAKTEVKYGKNAAMKKLAQEMIKQRNQEIKELQ
ncbi:MAG: DUF305 domain-containing protein [Bacteroidales bacterium]|nr:DUF305 domain-containing protein [Bacteroidales bacterium]